MTPMNNRLMRPRAKAGFDPRTISGLALWVDVSDSSTLTLNSTTISQVRDKSGNGRHANQATALNQPTYSTKPSTGQGIAVFNGTSAFMEGTAAFSTLPCTIFVAAMFPSYKEIGVIYEQITGTAESIVLYRGWSSLNDGLRMFNGANLETTGRIGHGQWGVCGGRAGATTSTSRVFAGGVAVTGNAGTLAPQTGGYYIARWAGASYAAPYTPMSLGEMICYQGALSDADELRVRAYLGKKWGVTFA